MHQPWVTPLPVSCNGQSQIVTVLGSQWGDEGKGKLVDVLAAESDVCCRFNGGSNAGHTLVVRGSKYALHLIPCGVIYPHTMNLLGNGVVIHLKTLIQVRWDQRVPILDNNNNARFRDANLDSIVTQEFNSIDKHIPEASERVLLSSRAHLVFDFHQRVDGLQENEKKADGSAIGTTKRGIGPCYSSKMSRTGIRLCDLFDWNSFEKKYRTLCTDYQKRYGFQHDCDEELLRHKHYIEIIRSRIIDGVEWIHQQLRDGKKILLEGANATFLDIDFGTYPFVTSSSTTAGGVCTGLGIPPVLVRQVIGVVKAYTTRVGEGPFLTELDDATGETLRSNGHEFGTTTGRPRRCGWFDAPMVRYSSAICGFVAVNLTKLDVLTGLSALRLCIGYRHKSTGKLVPDLRMPAAAEMYDQLEPVYEDVSGWSEKIDGAKTFEQLPRAAQVYVETVEKLIHQPIVWIGVGPERDQMIYRPP